MAIQIYCHRHGISKTTVLTRNLVQEIIAKRIPDPTCFKPTREFYEKVGIGQKRYWALYKGKIKPTDEEYLKLAEYFKVTLGEAFEMRQLSLFPEEQK